MKLKTTPGAARTRKHRPCQSERFCRFPTSLGILSLGWRGDAIHALSLSGEELGEEHEPPRWVARLIGRLQRHLIGEREDFSDVPVDLSELAPFQRQILVCLRGVGPGSTISYGELARRTGRPNAARAVGSAMRRNPIPLLVPCHRVLRSDGSVGGYSAGKGVASKRQLLAVEGVVL